MNILVPKKLEEIERQYKIEILWAVESGSRSWGFASPDSDFDVRFIYKRPINEYLKLNVNRDVIELPVDDTWDVNGWDLDKTLKLLNRSNPTFYEWMNSPIIYRKTAFRKRIEPLLELCFSEKRMIHHYLNTAKNNLKRNFCADIIKPKKYFYAIRPVLACEWVMTKHSMPPVLFEDLANEMLPASMKNHIERLLELKVSAPENFTIHQVSEINDYLYEEIRKISSYISLLDESSDNRWNQLNDFFYKEIS